jgi:hypothetical protein
VRSLMTAIAAQSRASRMAATAASLSLYGPDTASTFPVRESSLNSKAPRLVRSSSNVPATVYITLSIGAPHRLRRDLSAWPSEAQLFGLTKLGDLKAPSRPEAG